MTEHKYTDEEVIKALECCIKSQCENCCNLANWHEQWNCMTDIMKQALDLINRQSEDIDRLIEINSHNVVSQYEIKAEAVKEFAERLKVYKQKPEFPWDDWFVTEANIDGLVEIMTRRCPNCKHFVGCETACGGVPCDLYDEGDEK